MTVFNDELKQSLSRFANEIRRGREQADKLLELTEEDRSPIQLLEYIENTKLTVPALAFFVGDANERAVRNALKSARGARKKSAEALRAKKEFDAQWPGALAPGAQQGWIRWFIANLSDANIKVSERQVFRWIAEKKGPGAK